MHVLLNHADLKLNELNEAAQATVNSEIFARILFSRNFLYAEFG